MAVPEGGRGDLGRRVAGRREELGLSREEVAERAGFAVEYLRYVEERSGTPETASLMRLAAALRTSAGALLGGEADLPPGQGQAAAHPRLVELDEAECRDRLATHGVGRVAVCTEQGPAVVPVNYDVVDDAVVYRTAPGTIPARAVGRDVAFEVDRIDDALSEGWSVLVVGPAREVADPAETQRLAAAARTTPWAGGERTLWVRIEPTRMSGRRVSAT
jgi:nitroimidazol reductase NimA-like FMN-containing flavoprotein (pyridoxamine 5'-phosphate oxidase superfamily)